MTRFEYKKKTPKPCAIPMTLEPEGLFLHNPPNDSWITFTSVERLIRSGLSPRLEERSFIRAVCAETRRVPCYSSILILKGFGQNPVKIGYEFDGNFAWVRRCQSLTPSRNHKTVLPTARHTSQSVSVSGTVVNACCKNGT